MHFGFSMKISTWPPVVAYIIGIHRPTATNDYDHWYNKNGSHNKAHKKLFSGIISYCFMSFNTVLGEVLFALLLFWSCPR
jgi:hypothetical protein